MLPEVDLRPFADPVDDQKGTSSCVGFALAAGFDIRARIQGLQIPRISRVAIYSLARYAQIPLRDEGCRPRDAMLGIRHWGIVAESRVPFFEATINEPLPWDAFQAAIDSRSAQFWRIDSFGQDRVDAVRRALSAGFPVHFAMQVDAAMDVYRVGDVIGRLSGPDRGGHALLAVGYRATDGAFLVRNSWGRGYGDDGHCWVSPERIAEVWTRDLWVLEATPGGVS